MLAMQVLGTVFTILLWAGSCRANDLSQPKKHGGYTLVDTAMGVVTIVALWL